MCRFKSGAIYAALIGAVCLTGCASATTKAMDAEHKRSTMQRWTACLERNADVRKMPVMQIDRLMTKDCEGHKRDVLALYPPNMADQVDEMLASNAYRVIEAMRMNEESAIQSDGQVQTALR